MHNTKIFDKKTYLASEFTTLFILLPLAINYLALHKFFIILLWAFAIFAYCILKHDKNFDKKFFSRTDSITKTSIIKILITFLLATLIISVSTYIFEHERFLSFVLNRPLLWMAVMVLYPLLSVYPQELIYRAFFFHRYKNIFKSEQNLLILSGLSFGLAHIIFHNYIAVILSSMGGFLFGLNYQRNKSLILVSFEHALYGCMIFTVGLGWYFYRGAVGIN